MAGLRRTGGITRGTAKRTASAASVGGSAAAQQQFKLHGLKEVQESLDKLPHRLREKALKNASAAGARVIRNDAKRLAPVDTGYLRDHIVVARTWKKRGKRQKSRGTVVVGLSEDARFYGHLIEYGSSRQSPQPFLRPALNNKAKEAIQATSDKLGKEIFKQAKKLSGIIPMKKLRRLT